MKICFALVACIFLTLSSSSCSNVQVRQPAGDTVPELEAAIWEGTWLGTDGLRCKSLVVSAKDGIVEIQSLDNPDKDRQRVKVRKLGSRIVVTLMDEDDPTKPGQFLRAVVTKKFAAFFPADEDVIIAAVKTGKLRGKLAEDEDGSGKNGKCCEAVLESLSDAEAAGVSPAAAEDTAALFEADPAFVLVREKRPEPPAESGKKE